MKNALSSRQNDQSNRKFHSSSRNHKKELKLNLSKNKFASTVELFSDRRASGKKETGSSSVSHSRYGKSKLFASTSKLDKGTDKSTIISTLLSSQNQR